MSQPTNDGDLGPMPESTAVEPQLSPGGVDALPDEDDIEDDGAVRDLDPDRNPGVDHALPDGIAEPDEKKQEPNGEAGDTEAGTVTDDDSGDDPDAGQQAEDGSVEPPA